MNTNLYPSKHKPPNQPLTQAISLFPANVVILGFNGDRVAASRLASLTGSANEWCWGRRLGNTRLHVAVYHERPVVLAFGSLPTNEGNWEGSAQLPSSSQQKHGCAIIYVFTAQLFSNNWGRNSSNTIAWVLKQHFKSLNCGVDILGFEHLRIGHSWFVNGAKPIDCNEARIHDECLCVRIISHMYRGFVAGAF